MTPDVKRDQARELVERIRASWPDRNLREVRMFGAVAIMVDDAMAVAVHKDGGLLVRVDPAADAGLLEQPDASRAEMGKGRSMGPGWIRVAPPALRSDTTLTMWLAAATDCLAQRQRPAGPDGPPRH